MLISRKKITYVQFGFHVTAESGKLFHVKTRVVYLNDSLIKLFMNE